MRPTGSSTASHSKPPPRRWTPSPPATTGKGPFSYMHACFQFMTDPDGNPNTNDQPDAVGNSWGDTSSDSFPDLEWWPDIVAWRAAGIMPVFANANSGPAPGTVNEPG